MFRELIFYNPCNLGDLHVSRELVKHIARNGVAEKYYCAHRWSPRVLLDLGLGHARFDESWARRPYIYENGVLVINTWYAMSPSFGRYGISLNSLRDLFEVHVKMHGLGELPPLKDCVPTIDFSHYRTDGLSKLSDRIRQNYDKVALVCSGMPKSGQTRMDNGVFLEAICKTVLAREDVFFLFTNREGYAPLKNTAWVFEYTGLLEGECDLNECAFASTLCDTIIGRSSGAYTFALIRENLFDEETSYACFVDDERTARWIYPPEFFKAKICWSRGESVAAALSTIARALG